MYRNHEHYPDPTAGRALGSLRRKENQLNTGKQFEAEGCLVLSTERQRGHLLRRQREPELLH